MKTWVVVLSSLMLLLSCDSNKGEVPPLDLDGQGNITGVAKLFTANGNGLFSDGMQVTISNIDPPISAITDVDGFYTLVNVPYGIYDLSFEKEGFGTFKKGDIVHTEPETFIAERALLGQKSTTSITQMQVSAAATEVTISYRTDPPSSDANIHFARIFFHTSADVSDNIQSAFTNVIFRNSTPFNAVFTYEQIQSFGIPPGATVYALAYGDSFFSNYYKDPEFGIDTFPNLNPNTTAPVSFVIP